MPSNVFTNGNKPHNKHTESYHKIHLFAFCGSFGLRGIQITTVDFNTPYRRFKCIVVGIFIAIYMIYVTDFYIYIYLYVYVHGILYMYIYIYISPLLYIHSYIDTYVLVFSSHYILTARVFATTCETVSNGRTFVHFNTFKIFHLIEYFR